jgi:peptidoglycan/xylan/chitin deacetylase (PgdA/CDA1 family)
MRRTRRQTLSSLLVVTLLAACVGAPSGTPTGATPSGLAGSASPAPSATVSPGLPTPRPDPTLAQHLVVAGETLNSIAREHATSWQSLVYWNRDRYPSLDPGDPDYDPDSIKAGWTLALVPGVVLDYVPQPDPRTPAPTSGAPTATPLPGAPSRLVTHGDRSRNQVALTLDMGGRIEPAIDIMRWLVDHDVKATIFPTGAMTEQSAGRQVLAIVDAHPELFALGNHSYTHHDFRTLDAGQMRDELRRTEEAFGQITGRSPRPLFRPPFGGYDDETLRAAGEAGYAYAVNWDVDTIDWRPTSEGGPTADDIVAKVASQAQGGSIVLMHLGGYHTLEALPGIVRELGRRGFTFVTLTEMLGA